MVLIGVCHGAYWFWVMFTTRPMRISSQTITPDLRSWRQVLASDTAQSAAKKKLLNCRGLKMAKWMAKWTSCWSWAKSTGSTSVNCATVGETVRQWDSQLGLALIPDARAASLAPGLVTKWWIWSDQLGNVGNRINFINFMNLGKLGHSYA